MPTLITQIKNIKEAIELTENENYWSIEGELWSEGIECNLDFNMPFECSFEEHIQTDEFEEMIDTNGEEAVEFKKDMLRWLNNCLKIAEDKK